MLWPMVEFHPHGGVVSIRRLGRILRVEGGGATNLEGIQEYLALIAPWVAELRGSPWAVLAVVADQEALLTPDAEALLTERARQLSDTGRIAVGLVCPRHQGSRVLIAQWCRVYSEGHCEMRLFHSEEEASTWLQHLLAGATR